MACISLLIGGCTTPIQQRADIESRAWIQAFQQAEKDCYAPGDSFQKALKDNNRTKVRKGIKCLWSVSDQIVAPVAYFPDLYYQYKADWLKQVEDYYNKKITGDELAANLQAADARYKSGVYQRSSTQARTNPADNMSPLQKMGYVLQGMAEAQQRQRQQERNTTCTQIGNTLNCRTY